MTSAFLTMVGLEGEKSSRPSVCHRRCEHESDRGGVTVNSMMIGSNGERWHTRRKRDRWLEEDLRELPLETRPIEGETLDLILRKKVFLLQSRRGYRANTDSQLVAYFASLQRDESAVRRGARNDRGKNFWVSKQLLPCPDLPSLFPKKPMFRRSPCVYLSPSVSFLLRVDRSASEQREHYALDLGAGNGLVSILYGLRNKQARMVLLEMQDSLACRAERNVILNGLSDRAHVVRHDLSNGLPTEQGVSSDSPGFFFLSNSSPIYVLLRREEAILRAV